MHPFLQICLCDLLLWAHIYCCISQFDKIICLRNTNEVYTIKKPAVFFYHSRWSDYLARYYRNVMFVVLEYFIPCFVLFFFVFFFFFCISFYFCVVLSLLVKINPETTILFPEQARCRRFWCLSIHTYIQKYRLAPVSTKMWIL